MQQAVERLLRQLDRRFPLRPEHLFVVGCSTSSVRGQPLGTAGSGHVAEAIYAGLSVCQQHFGFQLAIQSCEHLNRCLVVESAVAQQKGWDPVQAVPTDRAGGALAAHAYACFTKPTLVEHIVADAGMDIGGTLIGMHLRPVAVPVRLDQPLVGQAHVIAAYTRPKLVGGERAIYRVQRGGV